MRYKLIHQFCAETGYTEPAVRAKIRDGIWLEGREHAQSQSRVMYRVWPPLKGGNNETWYDADWFEPAPPNAALTRRP